MKKHATAFRFIKGMQTNEVYKEKLLYSANKVFSLVSGREQLDNFWLLCLCCSPQYTYLAYFNKLKDR